MSQAFEVNFDGIVGLSHHYGGLSYGNVASLLNQQIPSNPKAAALQGLEKMKLLLDLGLKQAVLPPQERPFLPMLRRIGFKGTDQIIIEEASQNYPEIYYSCCSAASMWTANAATISPSADSKDNKVHITPANLSDKFHRAQEYTTTQKILKLIFADSGHFHVHPGCPAGIHFSDEGAANHNRFCLEHGSEGLQVFIYGKKSLIKNSLQSQKYPARQSLEASQAIFRNHLVKNAYFIQQNPKAIDAGVFHNDVISLANQNVFLYHEEAFVETDRHIFEIQNLFYQNCNAHLIPIKVKNTQISLEDAVKTYLFNSQLVTLPNSTMCLIAPKECEKHPQVYELIQHFIQESHNPIKQAYFLDLHQSMANGGGPACLRLRVVLNETEINKIHPHVLFTEKLYLELKQWIEKHYRDYLVLKDLADPKFYEESKLALNELTKILHLGNFYDFQN